MLREEELNLSPDQNLHTRDLQDEEGQCKSNKQLPQLKELPSPLNNNFLLSAEQSRHARQPSEGFMTSAHNLMNQDEFRLYGPGTHQDQDQINEEGGEEENSGDDDDELETSKLTLFTHEDGADAVSQQQRQGIDFLNNNCGVQLTEGSNFESNNFNYSESQYQAQLTQGQVGSFIGGQSMSNFWNYNQASARGSDPQYFGQMTQVNGGPGRDSVTTPFYYDENSLMNLSQSPTSILMLRNSNPLAANRTYQQQDRIMSSTKLNHKQQSVLMQGNMVQILEEANKEEDEQDESMLPPPSFTKHDGQFSRAELQQDEWIMPNKKYNPLELPLQRTFDSRKPLSPFNYQHQEQLKQNNINQDQISCHDELFSRGNPNNMDMEHMANTFYNLQQQSSINEDMVCNEDDIQLIKKKLDFSRLSSMQNLSYTTVQQQPQQIYLNNQPIPTYMFQTQNSLNSNQSFANDTQHYSTFQALNGGDGQRGDNGTFQFEDVLLEHMKTLCQNQNGVNTVGGDDNASFNKTFNRDEGVYVNYTQGSQASINEKVSEKINIQSQMPRVSSPTKTKSQNQQQKQRPPIMMKQQQNNSVPQKIMITNNNHPVHQVEIVQQNCINIFQGPHPHNLIQSLQVPPVSKTNSTNSYTGSLIETQQQQHINLLNNQQQLHNVQQSYARHNPQQHKKININPLSDTPREPSSILIDQSEFASQISQRDITKNNILYQSKEGLSHLASLQQTLQYMDHSGEILFDNTHNTIDFNHQQVAKGSKPKKIKIKKKGKESLGGGPVATVTGQTRNRMGTSKSRPTTVNSNAVQLHNPSNKSLLPSNTMSRTMIISKDKIQQSNSQIRQSVQQSIDPSSTQQISSLLKQNTMHLAQQLLKQKQPIVQRNQQQVQQVSQAISNNQVSFVQHQPQSSSPILNVGKSMPNSNQSSTQTSFLTQHNAKKTTKKTVTTNKKLSSFISKEKLTAAIDEDAKTKKLRKKNTSITRQQLLGTQKIIQVSKIEKGTDSNAQTKCNTHRSISRSKPRAVSEYTDQPKVQIFAQKKFSQHNIYEMQNKENIKPIVKQQKSTNLMGTGNHHNSSVHPFRPEDMISTFENFKLLNAQELLKEINLQQQRLSVKNITQGNLFQTLDTSSNDIGKRTKTEVTHNNNHIRSMQTFETANDIDPYNILMTIDSQRLQAEKSKDKKSKKNQQHLNNQLLTEISSEYSKKSSNHSIMAQQHHQSQAQMQKMQSPYDSKSLKNKFTSNKNKKVNVFEINSNNSSQLAIGIGANADHHLLDENKDNCKRCDELLNLLKTTRFLAR